MTILRESFAAVPNNTTVTHTNAPNIDSATISGTGTAKGDTTNLINGTTSLKITGANGDVSYVIQLVTADADGSMQMKIRFVGSVPSAAVQLLAMRAVSAGPNVAIFAITAANKFQVQDAAGAGKTTWTGVVLPDTDYYLYLAATPGTTSSNGTIEGGYFLGDSLTAAESYSAVGTVNAGTAAIGAYRFGKPNSAGAITVNIGDVGRNSGSRARIGPLATNTAPTANAGPDQDNIEPWATVTLAGSGSDTDGTIAGYTWRQISGTAVTLSSTSVASPTFAAPASMSGAVLVFGLVVTDDDGATSTEDTVTVSVLSPASAIASGGVWVPLRTLSSW